MSAVQLRGISFGFGGSAGVGRRVLRGLNLEVSVGEYLVILGESGSGKSTLLRLVAGLDHPIAGQILIDGRDMTGVPPRGRHVAMVFQDDALYPHLNVEQQIRFGADAKSPAADRSFDDVVTQTRVGDLLKRPTPTLSGGEKKRVALAKAIYRAATVRLLDEPLSAIDASHRQSLRDDLLRVHAAQGGATIHVTHDALEAMQLADRIAVLHDGTIVQNGTPRQLHDHPMHRVVCRLMNPWHLNEIRVGGDREVCFSADSVRVDDPDQATENETARFTEERDGRYRLPAELVHRHALPGGDLLTLRSGETAIKAWRPDRDASARPGPPPAKVRTVSVAVESTHWFDATSGCRVAPP